MRIGPELLQDLLDRVEGSLAAAIGTADGLLVEGVRKRPLDLEAAIAEHAALWRQARAASRAWPRLASGVRRRRRKRGSGSRVRMLLR